jgi:hypothetical protein
LSQVQIGVVMQLTEKVLHVNFMVLKEAKFGSIYCEAVKKTTLHLHSYGAIQAQ